MNSSDNNACDTKHHQPHITKLIETTTHPTPGDAPQGMRSTIWRQFQPHPKQRAANGASRNFIPDHTRGGHLQNFNKRMGGILQHGLQRTLGNACRNDRNIGHITFAYLLPKLLSMPHHWHIRQCKSMRDVQYDNVHISTVQ